MPISNDVIERLRSALQAAGHPAAGWPLVPLPDKGLAHDHVRLQGTGWLARIPKQSQLGLAAQDNLDYQRACFERAAASGHTPVLHGVLPPSDHLPRGALLVQAIKGRPARLPHDLPALGAALAAIHALPLPEAAARAPLLNATDPLQALVHEIGAQAAHLGAAGLPAPVMVAIEGELAAYPDNTTVLLECAQMNCMSLRSQSSRRRATLAGAARKPSRRCMVQRLSHIMISP